MHEPAVPEKSGERRKDFPAKYSDLWFRSHPSRQLPIKRHTSSWPAYTYLPYPILPIILDHG